MPSPVGARVDLRAESEAVIERDNEGGGESGGGWRAFNTWFIHSSREQRSRTSLIRRAFLDL
jgi:hypothetical protein